MKARAGKKKVVLELGGNAACIVDADAHLEDATERIVLGAFYQSGQTCSGVQRIMIHGAIDGELRDRLVVSTRALVIGDPRVKATFIGPMISEKESAQLPSWITSAVESGGKLLGGGERDAAMLKATLLEDIPKQQPICTEEAFGSVTVLSRFNNFQDVTEEVNDSEFGLQAGIFTRDIYKIQWAWDELEVGGVVIGDVPSRRVDNMPYGGVKDSGQGREDIRFAMEDMTEIRNLSSSNFRSIQAFSVSR